MNKKTKKFKQLGEEDFERELRQKRRRTGPSLPEGELPKISEDGWEYFDDCPICQAMRRGKDKTLGELTAAFKQARKVKNSHVYIAPELENMDKDHENLPVESIWADEFLRKRRDK